VTAATNLDCPHGLMLPRTCRLADGIGKGLKVVTRRTQRIRVR
jgi:hypothetical protein